MFWTMVYKWKRDKQTDFHSDRERERQYDQNERTNLPRVPYSMQTNCNAKLWRYACIFTFMQFFVVQNCTLSHNGKIIYTFYLSVFFFNLKLSNEYIYFLSLSFGLIALTKSRLRLPSDSTCDHFNIVLKAKKKIPTNT